MRGVVETAIQDQLEAALAPLHMDIYNESHMHSVPENSETHFKVILVSEKFDNLSRVQRHQLVNQVLSNLIGNPIHALSLKLFTLAEWQADPEIKDSPDCRGGRKKETRKVQK